MRNILRLLLTSEPSRAKQILTITLSVVVATLLWAIVTLNQPYSPTYDIPIKVAGIPDSLHLTSQSADEISVRVSGLGVDLVRGHWKLRGDTLVLSYDQLKEQSDYLRDAQFKKRLEAIFSEEVEVRQVSPGSLNLAVEAEVKKVVPVVFDAEIRLKPSYQLSESLLYEDHEVTVYGPPTMLDTIEEWSTEPGFVVQIDSQSVIQVPLVRPPSGINIRPRSIEVSVHPRRYTEATIELPVMITDRPKGVEVRLDHQNVEVACLIPIEMYHETLWALRNYKLEVPFSQLDPQIPYLIPSPQFPSEIKPISQNPKYLSFVIVEKYEAD